MSDSEYVLWQRLRGKQVDGFKFRRQHVSSPYILDFYCHSERLAVEVDGAKHGGIRDVARDRTLAARGVRVLHYGIAEVLCDLDGVVERIREGLLRG